MTRKIKKPNTGKIKVSRLQNKCLIIKDDEYLLNEK